MPEEEAKVNADNLVDANKMGVDSHGVTRLADYIKLLEKGFIKTKTELRVVKESHPTILYDAHNGWGQYAGKVAMEKAIEKSKKTGCGLSAVRNSSHFGTASYFARMASKNWLHRDYNGQSRSNNGKGFKSSTLGMTPFVLLHRQLTFDCFRQGYKHSCTRKDKFCSG